MSGPATIYFSGGRTSGYMLARLRALHDDKFSERFVVVFSNTGKEMPETLDFVHEVETRWHIPIVWTEYCRIPARMVPKGVYPTPQRNKNLEKQAEAGEMAHWFRVVSYETASRNGEPFDALLEWMSVLPNPVMRACSSELKIRTGFRYLFSLGHTKLQSYIGIRKDEEHRAIQILAGTPTFNTPSFPLVEWDVREKDVLLFWKTNDFDLRLKSYQGNCDLCFLKAKWKQVQVARDNPSLIPWWENWEAKKKKEIGPAPGAYFRAGRSIAEIRALAESGQRIKNTPDDIDIPCGCAERGFDSQLELAY